MPPLQLVKHLPKESQAGLPRIDMQIQHVDAGVIEKWSARKQPKRLKARI